ncbi:19300_t:CDS:2 [Cetraspora pellucida]|uniref:19300_t:CDS:1 n=1 Tax=Cetraspora pellucida TaxID=1433469 RepID=A0A9N9B1N9_9GLOM|nr:19300_t:CDS:2 [Cetraspora pellucida]
MDVGLLSKDMRPLKLGGIGSTGRAQARPTLPICRYITITLKLAQAIEKNSHGNMQNAYSV